MASFLYEGLLLFGVLMLAGLVFAGLTDQRHALQGQRALQIVLFAVLGLYFVGFWTHGGQTVAMKTWHIRLVSATGQAVPLWRAALRYILSWLWFVPALLFLQIKGLGSTSMVSLVLFAGALAYTGLTWFLPQRQFAHDWLAGTALVDTR